MQAMGPLDVHLIPLWTRKLTLVPLINKIQKKIKYQTWLDLCWERQAMGRVN